MNVNLNPTKMKEKALEKFDEYIFSEHQIDYYKFLELPLVCQQALWVEWFDAQKIIIKTEYKHRDGFDFSISYLNVEKFNQYALHKGGLKCVWQRNVALSKAIEKASEIFNNL